MDPDQGGAPASTEPFLQEPPTEMIRSEEELVVHRRLVPVERVRFVKRVVVEQVTHTFDVRREELHVERIPAGAGDADTAEGLGEGEALDFVLSEEELVVETRKRIVPVERVRVHRTLVTEQRPFAETLRREEIEITDVGNEPTGR